MRKKKKKQKKRKKRRSNRRIRMSRGRTRLLNAPNII